MQLVNQKHLDPLEMSFPVWVEPKYDGVRAVVAYNPTIKEWVVTSRNGKRFQGVPEIAEAFRLMDLRDLAFDGEIVGIADDREKQFSIAQSRCATETDKPDLGAVRFVVFDVIDRDDYATGIGLESFDGRRAFLKELAPIMERKPCISVIDGMLCRNPLDIGQYYQQCLESGMEGIVAKDLDSTYKSGDRASWRKLKPCQSAELELIDIRQGKGDRSGLASALGLVGRVNGHVVAVDCGVGMSEQQRTEIWHNREYLKGSIVEIKYQDVTSGGALRFPVFHRFRSSDKMSGKI